MVNDILIDTIRERLSDLHSQMNNPFDDDLYSIVASVMYNLPIEDCCEWKNDKPNPEGKERRNRAKQFLIPVVCECGGISSDDDDDYKKV